MKYSHHLSSCVFKRKYGEREANCVYFPTPRSFTSVTSFGRGHGEANHSSTELPCRAQPLESGQTLAEVLFRHVLPPQREDRVSLFERLDCVTAVTLANGRDRVPRFLSTLKQRDQRCDERSRPAVASGTVHQHTRPLLEQRDDRLPKEMLKPLWWRTEISPRIIELSLL